MNTTQRFIILDFLTIKPYVTFKNMIIFIAASLFIYYGTQTSYTIIGTMMGFGSLYVSYPFAVGEKNGIDALYLFLGIKRKTVIIGRYLYALIIDISLGLIGILMSVGVSLLFGREYSLIENLIVMGAMLMIFTLIQCFQLPLYFKLGYTKSKFSAYLPFLVIPALIIILGQFFGNLKNTLLPIATWIVAHPYIIIGFIIIVWLCLIMLSVLLSVRYYEKREF